MRIVQIIDSLRIGGAEKMTVLLCNLLVRNGHEITLISITDEVPLLNELDTRVKVILLNRRFKFSVAKMSRMNRLLSGFDIIHVHLFYNLKYLWVCGAFLKMRSKVVYHDHNGDIHLHREYSALQKYLFSKCDMICVSAEISEWAVHTLHLPQSRVFTLPNTIQRQPAPLMKYAPQPGLLRLVMVSNVRTTKNIEFALELVAALKRTLKLKLDIFGNVNDSEYFSFLESKMASLGVGEEVNFISGVSNIQQHLNAYDMALHTAKSESGPLVLIEYLARGIPFLTYRTGEVTTQISDVMEDFMIDNFSVDAWAQRVQDLHSRGRTSFGAVMERVYNEKFSEEGYYKKCITIYEKILAS